MHETIKNFHNTPIRFQNFEDAVARNTSGKADSVMDEIEFVRARKDFCSLFTDKIANGELPLRVTHNDTKLNNVLFDKDTLLPIAVIDLDTVMPGLSLYDFGDAIRFGTNPADEDENAVKRSRFAIINKLNDKFDSIELRKQTDREDAVRRAYENAGKKLSEQNSKKKKHVHNHKKKK